MTDDQLLQHLQDFMLDPAQFDAGNLRQHGVAWEFLFASFGDSAKPRQVLDWIKHGVCLDFVSPFSDDQRKHPRFASRMHLVEHLLLATVDKYDVHPRTTTHEQAQTLFSICRSVCKNGWSC